jgi:HK97 family phage major capsid protein
MTAITVNPVSEKRAIFDQMEALIGSARDAGRPMDAGESARYEELGRTLDAIDEAAQLREEQDRRHAELATRMAAPQRDPRIVIGSPTNDRSQAVAAYERAFMRYMRFGTEALEREDRQALMTRRVELSGVESRAMTTDAGGSSGGYAVPEGFAGVITSTMAAFDSIRRFATVTRTASGNPIPFPTMNDTGNEGEQLAEGNTVSNQDLALGSVTIGAFIFSSKLIKVSWALLEDEAVDLVGTIGRAAGERIGRIQGRRWTTGSGAGSQPQGITVGASTGNTTAAVNAITYDELIDLEHSVNEAYRDPAYCRYMFKDSTLAYVRKLRDGNDRPLWVPSMAEGVPARLNGWLYSTNPYFGELGDSVGTKIASFGDYRRYQIRDVGLPLLVRLNERYADALSTGFFAFQRSDGALLDTGAVKLLTLGD